MPTDLQFFIFIDFELEDRGKRKLASDQGHTLKKTVLLQSNMKYIRPNVESSQVTRLAAIPPRLSQALHALGPTSN